MTRSLIYLVLILSLHTLLAKDRDRNASTTPAMTEKAISAGFNHTLIIQEGVVFAWGENIYGQLGDGSFSTTAAGVPVAGLDHIIAVSAGRRHSMALRADGKVFIWGDNTYGQLGAVGAGSAIPIQLSGVSDIIDIQAGDFHCMALKSDGTVITWGINNLGELGQGFFSPSAPPGSVVTSSGTGVLNGVTLISAGARHSLAIKDGRVLGWGDNYNTQLGRLPSSFTSRNRPIAVRKKIGFFPIPLTDIISLSAGETHTMATDVEGNLWTWGEGVFGQLGIGGPIDPLDPTTYRRQDAVNVASKVRTMAAGYSHSTFIGSKGELHFFGANFHGQFGVPLTTTRVLSDSTVSYDKSVALACGSDFTIILKSNGSLVGAGDNAHTQFGVHPGPPAISSFVPFFNKTDRIAQLVNQENSFILRADGTVWSFGHKDYLGFSASGHVSTPMQIPGLSDIIALGATNKNAFALTVDGKVYAWGENDSGVCGQGTTTSLYTTPILIAALNDIVYIDGTIQGFTSSDGSSACAIDVNGDLYAWGNNWKYALGDGTNTDRLTPVRSTLTSKDFSVSMSKGNTLVLNADNTVEVWGDWDTDGAVFTGLSYTPKKIINSTSRFKSISSTREIRMALTVDGKIELWGESDSNSPNFFKICKGASPYYEVAFPSRAYESPSSSTQIDNVKFLESGDYIGYFIKADGSTWSWGANSEGQLGIGYESSEEVSPVEVSCTAPGYSVSMYSAVSSEHHALANLSGREIQSWGPNTEGQVGNGYASGYPVLSCNTAMRITNPVLGIENSQVLIYPNPTSEILHVELSDEMMNGITELRLIDASGRSLYSQDDISSEMNLDVSRLDAGIYILEVGSVKRRILIKK